MVWTVVYRSEGINTPSLLQHRINKYKNNNLCYPFFHSLWVRANNSWTVMYCSERINTPSPLQHGMNKVKTKKTTFIQPFFHSLWVHANNFFKRHEFQHRMTIYEKTPAVKGSKCPGVAASGFVFRNALLSHHDYIWRPQRWLAVFSSVFIQFALQKTCYSASRTVKDAPNQTPCRYK